jgi:leader peptidase (prepilin peptidase)/N-methyltransferase
MLTLAAETSHSAIDPPAHARILLLGAALGAVIVYDLRERRIPNRLVLPAAAACGLINALTSTPVSQFAPAAAMVLILAAIAFVKPDALGVGDVKLTLLIALAVPSTAARAVIAGLILATAVGMSMALTRREPVLRARVALAPFLAAGTVLALL